jgi:molecular chaperone GrpE
MNEENEVKIDEVSIDDVNPTDTADTTPPETETEKLSKQLSELNDKYLRLAAELENTRRRAALDAESRARNRAISISEKILPVMDAIDAALKHTPDDAGIQSMARAMESAFEQIGIKKIESIGQTLNPMHHNAIQVVNAPDTTPNTIVDEMQAGYMLGDTVLRTAMVIVAK